MFAIILSILSIGLIPTIFAASEKRLLQQVSCGNNVCADDSFCYQDVHTGEYRCISNDGMFVVD